MATKKLYKNFDSYLQKWLYCYAYSERQGEILLIEQALAKNGKYHFFNKIQEVIK